MKFKILIILFIYFFLSSNLVLAIGIGAKPSFLDLELKVGQPKEVKILVYNISQEAGIFQVFPDKLSEWIKIEPNNFRLEAGESKEVKIAVLAKKSGKKATNISVLDSPLNRQSFSINTGLKIPLRLNIKKEGSVFLASILDAFKEKLPWIGLGILAILLTGFFLLKYFKKRKKIVAPSDNFPIETSLK